jgi:hypothetical protein
MRKEPPSRSIRSPMLRVDREKYPGLETNPSLERALRIIQELERGRPREEAVEVAEMAMGASKARKVPAAKPAGRPRAHGKAGKVASAPKKRSHAPKGSHASPAPPKKRRHSV